MWFCSEITLCWITVFMYQCSGQQDPSSNVLKKSLWFMLATKLLLQVWCLSNIVWINKVGTSLSRTRSNLCSRKTAQYLCFRKCEGNTVCHILTGDIHWDLIGITKLVTETKMHGRNTKTGYITTAVLWTGLVLEEITYLYWKEEFILHSETSVNQMGKTQ